MKIPQDYGKHAPPLPTPNKETEFFAALEEVGQTWDARGQQRRCRKEGIFNSPRADSSVAPDISCEN